MNERATRPHPAGIASHLQELEDHLPLGTKSARPETRPPQSPIVVLDAIYHGGLTRRPEAPQAGYGLPNDLRVLSAVGSRTGTYSNILKLRYDSTFRPVADVVC